MKAKSKADWLSVRLVHMEILLALALLGVVFLTAAHSDTVSARQQMATTIRYIWEQCNRYNRIELASETKSLMRVMESVDHIARQMAADGEESAPLSEYAQMGYVSGLIVMDETVVLLSHKKADSYIHIDVEFGEGEGKIPVDSIAKRAEAYKPKEKVTYKMIKEYIEAKYGFKVHTAYIAEVKRNLGLPMYDAPNAVEELKQPRKHPTPEKIEAIKDALRYFAVI